MRYEHIWPEGGRFLWNIHLWAIISGQVGYQSTLSPWSLVSGQDCASAYAGACQRQGEEAQWHGAMKPWNQHQYCTNHLCLHFTFTFVSCKIYLMKREPSSFIKDYVIFFESKKCFDSQYNLRISKRINNKLVFWKPHWDMHSKFKIQSCLLLYYWKFI